MENFGLALGWMKKYYVVVVIKERKRHIIIYLCHALMKISCCCVFTKEARIIGPFNFLKEIIFKWWNANCSRKLKLIFNVIPCFILWEIWKKSNRIKHGERLSFQVMIIGVNRNIYRLVRCRYPWLRNISEIGLTHTFSGWVNTSYCP